VTLSSSKKNNKSQETSYDIIHFEALGPEAEHLKEEISRAKERGELPGDHEYLITPSNVQEFLAERPELHLPPIITTKTHSILPEPYTREGKKSVITRSAGYDHFEHLADTVNIASLREYCVNAVAQTAMKFLYAAAGELNHYTDNTRTFERKNSNAFMELDKHIVLTVYGVGKIGKRTYELAEANGLTVQGVDVRQEELTDIYKDTVHFVSKEEAIASTHILVNAMNLTRNKESRFYNVGYFSKEYLSKGKPGLIFINVTRGEIAPESGLLELYTSGKIRGIGLDVFSSESEFSRLMNGAAAAGADLSAAETLVKKALDRTGNIYVQPHQGFNSDIAARTKAVEAVKHVISWYKNGGKRFDEQLPYY
jgi:D-lactate dehydrogenase